MRLLERALAGEHLVEDEAETVEVALLRHRLPRPLLGRHVAGGAASDVLSLDAPRGRRQTEVGDPCLTALVEHDVRRLQVPVQNAFVVRRGKTGRQLSGDLDGFIGRQPTDATQERAEILPFDVLHGEKHETIRFADVVDTAHVGMGDLSGDADLPAKTLQALFIVREGFGEKLQRDGLFERKVVGVIDLSHAAFAHALDDAVARRQDFAGVEASVGGV